MINWNIMKAQYEITDYMETYSQKYCIVVLYECEG